MSATRRMLVLIFFGCLLLAAPTASADPVPVVPIIPVPPGPALCGGPSLPPCAAPPPFTLTTDQACAIIAWRTHVPCNWWGWQVPQGTLGSVG